MEKKTKKVKEEVEVQTRTIEPLPDTANLSDIHGKVDEVVKWINSR